MSLNVSKTKLQLKILGLASSKEFVLYFKPRQTSEKISLLNFLLEKDFAIAYSCYGKKVCKTCKVNLSYKNTKNESIRMENILSCSTYLDDILDAILPNTIATIEITYL